LKGRERLSETQTCGRIEAEKQTEKAKQSSGGKKKTGGEIQKKRQKNGTQGK